MQARRIRQQEFGHVGVDDLAALGHAQEAALHGALRRADLGPRAVLEALARRQHRLVADDGQPVEFGEALVVIE